MPVLRRVSLGIALLTLGCGSVQLSAHPLEDALAEVYARSPRLQAERANVRALDEEVARANSGYRPSIVANAEAGGQRERDKPASLGTSGVTQPLSYGVSITQPLFNGFRTYYGVREAKSNVEAGRAGLLGLEATVLLEAVRAYMDIVRDEALLKLRRSSLAHVERELAANRRRQQEGGITRTDVSQTLVQQATFESLLRTAEANLQSSRASYLRVLGEPPRSVREYAPRGQRQPSNLNEAMDWAARDHPSVLAARHREAAARLAVDRIRSELLPSAQLHGSYTRRHEPSVVTDDAETLAVRGVLSVPLYTGGEVEARVRQAKQTHVARLALVSQTVAESRAQAAQSFAAWNALRQRRTSDELLVRAATQALDGVRKEEKAGQRTVAELLSAELALVNAEASFVSTRHEFVIASFSLLNAVGRLTPGELRLGVANYDPDENFKATERRWRGIDITYPNGRREHLDLDSADTARRRRPTNP